jgi:hypothetical protein
MASMISLIKKTFYAAEPVIGLFSCFQKSHSGSGSDSDASVVLEMNEKLLEAHKKVVQSRLSREVARTILDAAHQQQQPEEAQALGGPVRPPAGGGGSRRWGPHLEGIPEESRANTLTASATRAEESKTTAEPSAAHTKDQEKEEERATRTGGEGGQQRTQPAAASSSSDASSQMKKLSTSDPQSLDSGILTRSSSISDISDSQTDIVTSNEFDTDNETVDVADSDDGESDTEDSETYADGGHTSDPGREEEGEGGSSSRLSGGSESAAAAASSFPQHEAFLRYQNRRQKKDFVSELYHTAVAKVPKVIPSDSESLYSSQSTMRRDFEYDSLDINSNCRYKDIYTNPNMAAKRTRAGDSESHTGGKAAYRNQPTNHNSTDRDDYEIVNVKSKEAAAVSTSGGSRENVAEMYVNKEYDASTLGSSAEEEEEEEEEPGYEYSAGEKMMISISGDNESVYSNKLLISVNGGGQGAAQPRAAHGSPSSRNFDPDTLERGNASAAVSAGNKKGEQLQQQQQLRQLSSAASEFLPSSQSARFSQPAGAAANQGQNKSSFYLFREEDQVGHRLPAAAARGLDSMTAVVVNSKPSLPPKTRLTPKLPPKPIQKGRPVPRPLPPPPPPAPNLA